MVRPRNEQKERDASEREGESRSGGGGRAKKKQQVFLLPLHFRSSLSFRRRRQKVASDTLASPPWTLSHSPPVASCREKGHLPLNNGPRHARGEEERERERMSRDSPAKCSRRSLNVFDESCSRTMALGDRDVLTFSPSLSIRPPPPPPHTTRVPLRPSGAPRGPRRTRVPTREAQDPLETTRGARLRCSSSQSVSACFCFLSSSSIQFSFSLSSPDAFPAPFRPPLPPRGSRCGREELGAEKRGNGRERRESFERRIRVFFFSFLLRFHSRALRLSTATFFFFNLNNSHPSSQSTSNKKKQPRGATALAPSPSARSASTSARPSC